MTGTKEEVSGRGGWTDGLTGHQILTVWTVVIRLKKYEQATKFWCSQTILHR